MIEASTSVCLLLATALLWVQIEVIAQAVGNTITKPRNANVQRHRANAGCNFDQTISDYYKVNVLFPFNLLTMWSNKSTQDSHNDGNEHWALTKSIDTRDQIEILKHYKKFLTMKEFSYFSVEVQKWKK